MSASGGPGKKARKSCQVKNNAEVKFNLRKRSTNAANKSYCDTSDPESGIKRG